MLSTDGTISPVYCVTERLRQFAGAVTAIAFFATAVWAVGAQGADEPAGADKTKVTDWTDPRPAEWSEKYPLFGPVSFGDGSLKRIQDAGTIKICAFDGTPPYLYRDAASGEIVGSDRDMAGQVMSMLGISNIEYVPVQFASLIPALQADRCDIVMNSIIIRSDRAKAEGIRYTTPYTLIYALLSVREDSPYQSIKDMKGTKIGSVAGSTDAQTLEAVVAEVGGGIETVLFDSTNECYLATVTKITEGCMFDDGTTVGALKQYEDLRTTDELFTFRPTGKYEHEPEVNPYVFGAAAAITRAEDNDLNRALSIALTQMVNDGTQKKILQKWDMWHEGQDQMIRPES